MKAVISFTLTISFTLIYNQKNINIKYDGYEANNTQINLMRQILFLLDDEYVDDYDYWLRICFALKSYSNTEGMFNLFLDFSQRSTKFDPYACKIKWNSCSASMVTFATIVKYFNETIQKYETEEKKEMMRKLNKIKSILFLLNKEKKAGGRRRASRETPHDCDV